MIIAIIFTAIIFIYLAILPFAILTIMIILIISHSSKTRNNTITQNNIEYFDNTHTTYFNIRKNKGKLGEFNIYTTLKNLPGYKKFLFNCYIPKPNGQTTEIDVILLHQSGIYVFESKNYSGWIFGHENDDYWTQTLHLGYGKTQKNQFYNPYKQNEAHIKYLKNYLENFNDITFFSYIVFSNNAEFKKITTTTTNKHYLTKLLTLYKMVEFHFNSQICLNEEQINTIYNKLYPLSQVDETTKTNHIQNVLHLNS